MRFAVVGHPVRHSLSPVLFEWLFARLGIDATYVALDVAPADLAATVEAMRAGEWAGLSVTLPHKEAVRGYLDREDERARAAGAVNTLVPEDSGKIAGYNTDLVGCFKALEVAGARVRGARVVVLGAGGAGRAAFFGALGAGASQVSIANRTPERAQALVDEAQQGTMVELTAEGLGPALVRADIVINTTKVGMGAPEESPLPRGCVLPSGRTVLDMVYRPRDTRFLREARGAGCKGVDGLWMLVYQALEQLRLWTGHSVTDEVARELHEHLKAEAT